MNYSEEPKEEYFYNWISNILLPCGIVYSSQNAKNILLKNNLTPSQFLRPFGDLRGTTMNFQINGNANYNNTIKDFKIDFYDAENFKVQKIKINDLINNCLKHPNNIPLFDIYDIHVDKNNIEATLSKLNNYSFRYYNEIEKLIFEYCFFDSKEYYQQPFLFIFLCDINDDPLIINKIKLEQEPNLLNQNIYDNIHNPLILLLNDKNSENFISDYNIIQTKMNSYRQKFYSYPVFHFDINTNSKEEAEKNNIDYFIKYIHPIEIYSKNSSKIIRGKYMKVSELSSIKIALKDFFQNTFIKRIIDVINEYDSYIQKKKNLFGFDDKDNKKSNNHVLTKLEKKMYILTIYQFYIKDYKNSLNNLEKLLEKIKDKKPTFEISLIQLKNIIEFLKSKKQKKKVENSVFTKYLNIMKNEIGAFRALFISIRMMECFNIKGMEKLILDSTPNLYNSKINFLIPLIYEKLSYYCLIDNNPRLGKFAYYTIQYLFKYFQDLRNDSDISNTYLLHFLGSLFNIFNLNGNPNDNIHQSFSKIKKLLFFNMGLLSSKLGYIEGTINFYSKFIELYKNLNCKLNTQNMFNNNQQDTKQIMFVFNELIKICEGKNIIIENFSIPEIDNNLIIFNSQDLLILKNNFPTNFLKICNEYKELSVSEKYSLVSKNDIDSLKLIDYISNNKNQIQKYCFFKNKYVINIEELISIRIIFRNVLPVDINITDINLIFENTNDTIFLSENKKINLKSQSENFILLHGKFIVSGNFTLIGISFKIFSSIEIKKQLNCEYNNFLYYQLENKTRIKYDLLSNTPKLNNKYYYFEVISHENNIRIVIANNQNEVTIFNYEIYFLPIQMFNTYKNIKMNKFTIYLLSEDKNILYPKLVYNEDDISDNNIIYVPIIPLSHGSKTLSILIKFEERKESIEVKRFFITLNVLKSVCLSFKNNILEYNKNTYKQKIRISMNINNKENFNNICFLNENEFWFSNQFSINSSSDWNAIGKEKYDKFYKTITIEQNNNLSKTRFNIDIIKNYPFKADYNKKNIQKFFEKLINKRKKFLFFFNMISNFSDIKTFVYCNDLIYSDSDKKYQYNEQYFSSIFEKCLNIENKIEQINNNEYYISLIINYNFSKYYNYFLDNIKSIIFQVKLDLHNFDWIGLTQYKINKFDEDNKIIFKCILNKSLNINFITEDFEDGININQIEYIINLKEPKENKSTIILDDFPYPIYITL